MRSSLHQSVFLSIVLSILGCGAADPPPPQPPPPVPPPEGESTQAKLLVAGDDPGGAHGVEMVSPPMSAADGDTSERVAYYRFDEIDGPVLDSSGRGHHGRASNVLRGEKGRFGRGIFFTGNGFVQVPASKDFDFTGAATIELWVMIAEGRGPGLKRTSGADHVGSTVSRGTGNNDDNVLMNTSCGNMQTIFSRHDGPTTNVTCDCDLIRAGNWTHVAVVNDGKELRLYLDGALTKVDKGGVMGPIPSDLFIGRREQGIFGFQGAMDEIQWWRVVRTQPQICSDAGGSWNGKSCVWER